MKWAPLILLLLVGAALSGCSDHTGSDAHHHGHSHEGENHGKAEAASYEEGRGLSLTAAAEEALGIETAPVTEQTLPLGFSGTARVFHAAHQHTTEFPGQKDGFGYAMVMVPLELADFLQAGQRVQLFSGTDQVPIEGAVARLNRETARAIGQVEVVLEFSDPEEEFEFGTVLRVQFAGSERTALVIPRPALVDAAAGNFVYRAVDGRYRRVPIQTGGETEKFIEVVEGLPAGAEIVTAGAVSLWLTELRLTRGGGHVH